MLTTTSCENCVIKLGGSQSPHRIAFLQEAKVRLSLHNIINDNDDETLAFTKRDNFCVCKNSVSSSKFTYIHVFQTMFSHGTKTAVRQSYYVKLISSDDHYFRATSTDFSIRL